MNRTVTMSKTIQTKSSTASLTTSELDEIMTHLGDSLFQQEKLELELSGYRTRRSLKLHYRLLAIKDHIRIFLKKAIHRKGLLRFDDSLPYTVLDDGKLQELPASFSVAIHLHIYFMDLLPEILGYLDNIPMEFDCLITTNCTVKKLLIERTFHGRNITVRVSTNQGRDIAPWLIEFHKELQEYDLVCHIHTKKSRHVPEMGRHWRQFLLNNLLGSRIHISRIFQLFYENDKLGLAFSPCYWEVKRHNCWDRTKNQVEKIINRCGLPSSPLPKRPAFPAGTMLWYRPKGPPIINLDSSYRIQTY